MRSPDVNELPPPPTGRTGWPWTKGSDRLPDSMPDGRPWPRMSVVTPSYNQATYLEETIRSVLLSGYPDLEYMVVDGGSDDGSAEIIEKYEPWLAYWVSEKDSGQSEAINKGWRRATGRLIAWINSDDTYLPDAFGKAALAWGHDPEVAMVAGGYESIDADSKTFDRKFPSLPSPGPLDVTLLDHETWRLTQPASFFSRVHLDRVGRWVREDLQYTMDREIMYRICRAGRIELLQEPLATYRIHLECKTRSRQPEVAAEARKSFAYCDWGGPEEAAIRRRVCRWRMAQSYRLHGTRSTSTREALPSFFRAAYYRPGYLGDPTFLRLWGKEIARMLARITGVYEPLRSLRDRWRGSAGDPVLSRRHG